MGRSDCNTITLQIRPERRLHYDGAQCPLPRKLGTDWSLSQHADHAHHWQCGSFMVPNRPGHRNSCPIILGSFNHCAIDFRVPSVSSNLIGFCILLCSTEVRSLTCPAAKTSATWSRTRSHPRNLLSFAVLNSARSLWFSAISSRTRLDQTCFGIKGRFCPTIRRLFQAGRCGRMAGKFGVCMMDFSS